MTRLFRERFLKFSLYAVIVFLSYVLQNTPGVLSYCGISPILVLPACLCIAAHEGPFAGGLFGFIFGFFCDTGTEIVFDCDTLLLSVGLIPENELTKQAGIEMDPKTRGPKVDPKTMATSVPGIFAGGNVVRVYDLVDWVSRDSEIAGRNAAKFAREGSL